MDIVSKALLNELQSLSLDPKLSPAVRLMPVISIISYHIISYHTHLDTFREKAQVSLLKHDSFYFLTSLWWIEIQILLFDLKSHQGLSFSNPTVDKWELKTSHVLWEALSWEGMCVSQNGLVQNKLQHKPD